MVGYRMLACAMGLMAGGLLLASTAVRAEEPAAATAPADATENAEAAAVADADAETKLTGDERVKAALQRRISTEFVELPLSDVVAFLEKTLGVNVVLDARALEDAGAGADTPITRNLKDITARAQLDLILGSLDLTWVVRDGVLLITTPEKSDCAITTTVYPVSDLLGGVDEFGEPVKSHQELLDLITTSVLPTTWDEVGGPASIHPLEGNLAVVQTDYAHQQISRLLETIRELRKAPTEPVRTERIWINPRATADQQLREKLKRDVTLEYVEALLSDVADHLAHTLEMNVVLDTRALEDAGAGSDTPITFKCQALPLDSALNLMLGRLDLTWTVRNEVLFITTPEIACRVLPSAVYPVADLLQGTDDREGASESLIKAIAGTVAPTSWEVVGGHGTLAAISVVDAIMITQTSEVHEQVAQLLEQYRAARSTSHGKLTAEPRRELRIYSLAPPATPRRGENNAATQPAAGGIAPATLAGALQQLVEPQSWDEEGTSFLLLGDKLVVRQTPAVHRRLGRVLSKLQSEGITPASSPGGGFFSIAP